MREYDLIADWYRTDRGRTVGVAEALAFAARLQPGSYILDLGCGNGVPITEAFVKAGHRVVGLDTSIEMLTRFRINLLATPIVRGEARRCPFSDATFDAAVSWGFTAAEIEGADEAGITGTMNGVTFHYYAVPSYRRLLAEHGMELVDVHDDPGVSTYFLARRVE